MSNRHIEASANDSILFIALNRLKESPRNVRKLPHTKADLEALAASIKAHGMLQNLVVEEECLTAATHPARNFEFLLALTRQWNRLTGVNLMGLGRGALFWLLGVPIPIIILLMLFWR